jgi:hypothetical protein
MSSNVSNSKIYGRTAAGYRELLDTNNWSADLGLADLISMGADRYLIIVSGISVTVINTLLVPTKSFILPTPNIPTLSKFLSISGSDINNIWAVAQDSSSKNHIIYFNGTSWNEVSNNLTNTTTANITDIAVGFDGSVFGIYDSAPVPAIYNYQSSIDSWVESITFIGSQSPTNNVPFKQIFVGDLNYIWLVDQNYNIYISLNYFTNNIQNIDRPQIPDGSTLNSLFIYLSYDGSVWCLYNYTPSGGSITTGISYRTGMAGSIPQGTTWVPITINNSVDAGSIKYLAIAGDNTHIGRGNSTFAWPLNPINNIIFGLDSNNLYYYYNPNTKQWSSLLGVAYNFFIIGSDGYLLGCNNQYITIQNIFVENFQTFLPFPNISGFQSFYSLNMADINNIWGTVNITGQAGIILNYNQNINNWQNSPNLPTTSGSSGPVLWNVVGVGFDGTVFVRNDTIQETYYSQDGGNTWNVFSVSGFTPQIIVKLAVSSINYVWAYSNSNIVVHLNGANNPYPLTDFPSQTPVINSVYICYDGTVLAVINNNLYQRTGISISNPIGSSWLLISTNFPTSNFSKVLCSPGRNGNIYLNNDVTRREIFNYTGTIQTFTSPITGVIKIYSWGAGGAGGLSTRQNPISGTGGGGAFQYGEFTATAGQQLSVIVGQGGSASLISNAYQGGGAGTLNPRFGIKGGGGGGFSSVSVLNGQELITTGAGGGGSVIITSAGTSPILFNGGAAFGSGTSQPGINASTQNTSTSGQGASAGPVNPGPGIGGTPGGEGNGDGYPMVRNGGNSGSSKQGGNAANNVANTGGAGGGGGYFGGGSGAAPSAAGWFSPFYGGTAGGGGSSYFSNLITNQSSLNGNYQIPGGQNIPGYIQGIGMGGNGLQDGGNGLVILEYNIITNPNNLLNTNIIGYNNTGNVNNTYTIPYYSSPLGNIAANTQYPSYPTRSPSSVIPTGSQIVWGISQSGNAYLYNNKSGNWSFVGQANCLCIGSNQKIVYSNLVNTQIGEISTSQPINITWNVQTLANPTTAGFINFTSLAFLNPTNLWAIDNTGSLYNAQNNIFTLYTSTPKPNLNVAIGFDATLMGTDSNANVYIYSNSIWTLVPNINLTQISIITSTNYWGVNNNVIYQISYGLSTVIAPPLLNTPIYSCYISASYDGTIWALINNFLYKRDGITTTFPGGTSWLLITSAIVDNIISIVAGSQTSPVDPPNIPNPVRLVQPLDTMIWGIINGNPNYVYNNGNTTYWQVAPIYTGGTPANCLSVGSDGTIIYSDSTYTYIRNGTTSMYPYGIEWGQFVQNPPNVYFRKLACADINNIWGIGTSTAGGGGNSLYQYTYSNNTPSWTLRNNITGLPTDGSCRSISIGSDGSIMVVYITNVFRIIGNTSTPITGIIGDQISNASGSYYATAITYNMYSQGIYIYNTTNNTNPTSYYATTPTEIGGIISVYVSVSSDGTIWGLYNNNLYKRTNITSTNMFGLTWINVLNSSDVISSFCANSGPSNFSYLSTSYTFPFYPDNSFGSSWAIIGGNIQCLVNNNWVPVPTYNNFSFKNIYFGYDSSVFALDDDNTLYIRDGITQQNNTGTNWALIRTPYDFTNIAVYNKYYIYGIYSDGNIYYSSNGGFSWTSFLLPTDINNNQQIGSKISVGFDETVVVLTQSGSLYYFSNGNFTDVVDPTVNINYKDISVQNSNNIWCVQNPMNSSIPNYSNYPQGLLYNFFTPLSLPNDSMEIIKINSSKNNIFAIGVKDTSSGQSNCKIYSFIGNPYSQGPNDWTQIYPTQNPNMLELQDFFGDLWAFAYNNPVKTVIIIAGTAAAIAAVVATGGATLPGLLGSVQALGAGSIVESYYLLSRVTSPGPTLPGGASLLSRGASRNENSQTRTATKPLPDYRTTTGSKIILTTTNYYYGTENYNGTLPPSNIISPESTYFTQTKNTSFLFGIAYGGSNSNSNTAPSMSSLGIYQSLYNQGYGNFNYFSHSASNSQYTNFLLNYNKIFDNSTTAPIPARISIQGMIGQYYQTNQLTLTILTFSNISNQTITYDSITYSSSDNTNARYGWITKILNSFNLNSSSGAYTQNSTIKPLTIITFNEQKFQNIYNQIQNPGNLKQHILGLVSRCDTIDNMSIPISVGSNIENTSQNTTGFDSTLYNTINPQGDQLSGGILGGTSNLYVFPMEFVPSCSGNYRTPNASIFEYSYRTDNVMLNAEKSTDQSGNIIPIVATEGTITNGIINPIQNTKTNTSNGSSTNLQLSDMIYTTMDNSNDISNGNVYLELTIPYSNSDIEKGNKNISSLSGNKLDIVAIMPLLQRKLNNIIGIINPINNITNNPFNFIKYYFQYPNQTYISNAKYVCSVFPQSELSNGGDTTKAPGMWDIMYNNYSNYGIASCTFKHTIQPHKQCQVAYGFDDPYYGPYPVGSNANDYPSNAGNPGADAYTPTITWLVLQKPSFSTTLQKCAFGKSISNNQNSALNVYLSSKNFFPYYNQQNLSSAIQGISTSGYTASNMLSYYTSALSDYYLVPWLQKNGPPFHIFITSIGFIPCPYMYEQAVSNCPLFLFADNPVPNPQPDPLPFNYISRSVCYCPQQQLYIVVQGNLLRTYFQYGNTNDLNFVFSNQVYTLCGSDGTTPLILQQTRVYCDHKGNIFITSQSSNAIYFFNQSLIIGPNANIACITGTQINSNITSSCLMITSLHQDKGNNPPKNKMYLGVGNSTAQNLFVSTDYGNTFTNIAGTPSGNITSIVPTCKIYNQTNNGQYFQYAVVTDTANSIAPLNKSSTLSFITEVNGNINGPPNIYTISNVYYAGIYGIEYCPTMNYLFVAYINAPRVDVELPTTVLFDIYDCSVLPGNSMSPNNPTMLSTIITSNITGLTNLPTTNFNMKYVGKQLLVSIDNIVYALTDYGTSSSTSSIPTSLTFTTLYTDINGNPMLDMF